MSFIAKNHPQQIAKRGADDLTDQRTTPDEIYLPLNEIHRFTLDAAATSENRKCEKFYSLAESGLERSWAGETVWCNPPFSGCGAWAKKAFFEVFAGSCPKVVMLLPANRTEQAWWQTWIEPFRDRSAYLSVDFIRGRVRFGYPEGLTVPIKGDRPPFGICIVTFRSFL